MRIRLGSIQLYRIEPVPPPYIAGPDRQFERKQPPAPVQPESVTGTVNRDKGKSSGVTK